MLEVPFPTAVSPALLTRQLHQDHNPEEQNRDYIKFYTDLPSNYMQQLLDHVISIHFFAWPFVKQLLLS